MTEKLETETVENTPALEALLIKRLRAFLATAGPRVHADDCGRAVLKFELYAGDVHYLDDDTPYLTAHVEETFTSDDIEGHIGPIAKGRR